VTEPSPRARVLAECTRRGRTDFAAACADLIEGGAADDAFVRVLGGRTAPWWFAHREDEELRYWPRVWAARGLLWAWDDAALPAISTALRDPAWRVREMAAKVIARNLVGDALDDVAPLRADPVRRVRVAATRAVATLTARRA
jgi:hypothetical protein